MKYGTVIRFKFGSKNHVAMIITETTQAFLLSDEGTGIWPNEPGPSLVLGLSGQQPDDAPFHVDLKTATRHILDDEVLG